MHKILEKEEKRNIAKAPGEYIIKQGIYKDQRQSSDSSLLPQRYYWQNDGSKENSSKRDTRVQRIVKAT